MPYLTYRNSNKLGPQKLAAGDLYTRTLNNFKEVLQQHQEIESHIESLKSFLERESKHYDGKADSEGNLDSKNVT